MNLLSIYKLGSKLLDILEVIHGAGYVHNDLSLQRIVPGPDQKLKPNNKQANHDWFSGVDLHLNDFSLMTPYMDFDSGNHLKKDKVEAILNLNNEFQTLNKVESLRTSRKDDLEMLCNILISLINDYELPCLEFPSATIRDSEKRLYFLQAYKRGYTLGKLCKLCHNENHGL